MNEEQEKKMMDLYLKIVEDIERNTDHREKVVGDKVRVWDGSNNVDNKGRARTGIDPLFKNETAIVADVNCEKKLNKRGYAGIEDRAEILDVELYFPDSDITVWTKSGHIQLLDFQ